MKVKKQQLELDMEKQTSSKLGKEYIKAVYCHPAYLTYMQGAVLCLVAQWCLTLCYPMPGSSVHGISQARILEWIAAGVQPQLIQGIRRRDGIGEGQETTA